MIKQNKPFATKRLCAHTYKHCPSIQTQLTPQELLLIYSGLIYKQSYNDKLTLTVYNKFIDDSKKTTYINIDFSDIRSNQDIIAQLEQSQSNLFATKVNTHWAVLNVGNPPPLKPDDHRITQLLNKHDLILVLSKSEAGFNIDFKSNNLILQKNFQAAFTSLSERFSETPNTLLLKHSTLTKEDVDTLRQFEAENLSPAPFTSLTDIISKYAESAPNKIAVETSDSNLNYQALHKRANQVANTLISLGIKPGNHIAVLLPPNVDIITSILAIHKCNAVYVPIDPTFPIDRINAIYSEAQPELTLTVQQLEKILPSSQKALHIDRDTLSDDSTTPAINIQPSSNSHIFFTSGTTGQPKGVVATHQNLHFYLHSAAEKYRFDHSDKFISAARPTFSISLFELLLPLYVGAQVKILDKESVLNLESLSQEIANSTVFHFGPSLLKQLLPHIKKQDNYRDRYTKIKHASSGGDLVPPHVLENLKDIFSNAEIYVIYGSSEISCMGCTYPVSRKSEIKVTKVGRPFPNVSVKILDQYGNRCPVGIAGTLYFSGPGLIKEYLNLPQLNKEKFVNIEGKRYYAIGDVGKYDLSGNIQLLGRNDYQVQVRGMRVELGEIESQLRLHSDIQDCVVTGYKANKDADTSLVAYVTLKKDCATKSSDIRSYLIENLPDYMVPSQYVKLDRLPTNHNNKLDRSALPPPDEKNILKSHKFEKAETATQKSLLDIWKSVFQLNDIGIHDNFFELGGDSLKAVNVLSEIDKQLNQFIPIEAFIDHSTIDDLAKIIDGTIKISEINNVKVLKQGDLALPPIFCLYGVLLYQDLAQTLAVNNTVCGVYLSEEIDTINEASAPFSSVEHIAELYLNTIQKFQANGPYYLCGESFGGIIALEVAKQLIAAGETVNLVAMLDSNAPNYSNKLPLQSRVIKHIKKVHSKGFSYLEEKLKNKFLNNKKPNKPNKKAVKDHREGARHRVTKFYKPAQSDIKTLLFKASIRSEFESYSQDLGWSRHLTNLTTYDVQGDHIGILKKPNVQDLAEKLSAHINQPNHI